MSETTKEQRKASRREQLAWKVWGYVRQNARSLMAETHSKWIEQAVSDLMADQESEIEELRQQLDVTRATVEMFMRNIPNPNSGSRSFTAERARHVIELAMGRGIPQVCVARRYGTEPRMISKIVNGEIWAKETENLRKKYAKVDAGESVRSGISGGNLNN